jgi:cell pole-organizing protein PopZ
MPQQKNAEEIPSMEDILRSIRGVISDDTSSEEDDDILELDDDDVLELGSPVEEKKEENPMADEEKPSDESSVLDDIDSALSDKESTEAEASGDDADWGEALAEADDAAKEDGTLENSAPPEDAPTKPEKTEKSESLIEENTAKKTSATIKELIKSIPKDQVDSPTTRNGTSLEDLAIEAMRPMLAEWLNDNLDVLVKQLVEKEIKKLVPRDDE